MKQEIINAVKNLQDDLSVELVHKAIKEGFSKKEVIEWINIGMSEVGKLFNSDTYYIADLIVAGTIYREILTLKEMDLRSENENDGIVSGKILIGTVEDDIHDIGKDIFISIAKSEGFNVCDLGVDISPMAFLEQCVAYNPDILAMSGILTSSIKYMKETADLITMNYLRTNIKIILGGQKFTNEIFQYIGADYAANNADIGIAKCKAWMKEKHENK